MAEIDNLLPLSCRASVAPREERQGPSGPPVESPLALGRRNWLFAGRHSGGERAAAMYSILQTTKLNGVNPEAYLTDALSKTAAGHPINRISELMPWVYRSPNAEPAPDHGQHRALTFRRRPPTLKTHAS
jgi:IS66 C-terminal element